MNKKEQAKRNSEKIIGVRELKEIVGSLVYMWSSFERALNESVDDMSDRASKVKAHGIAQKLNLWKTLNQEMAGERPEHMEIIEAVFSKLSEALKLRNCISHGQRGLHGCMAGNRVAAHINTELNGIERNFSFVELMMTLEFLERASRLMEDITYAAKQPDSAQLDDLYSQIRIQIERSRT